MIQQSASQKTRTSFVHSFYALVLGSVLCFSAGSRLSAQVIFSESFDEVNGSVSGTDNTGGVMWNSTCPTCLAGDHYEVQSGVLEGQDTNGPATWETGSIDISSCTYIEIGFSISSQGTMEACGTGCNSVDWVQLEYNIDGSGWQTPSNATFCAGACADLNVVQADDVVGGTTLYTTGCIMGGNSIQFRIVIQTWASDEYWKIDDVTLSCASGPTANAGADVSICQGTSVTLNGSGTGTPLWSPGATLSATNVLNPVATPTGNTTYTLTMTSGACTASDDILVSVLAVSPITVSPDQTICEGDCATLTVSGGDFFVWNADPDISDSSLTTQTVCPAATTTYSVTSYTVGTNLITNGDFSAGNSGFSSSYTFTDPTNTSEAQYNVIPNPQTYNGGFSPCTDHTSGSGNMLVVNGSSTVGASVWCQTIPVTPNTDYLFSAWLASVYPVNPAVLQFTINGVPVGSNLNASATTCVWNEFFTTWNSGASTSATICITNLNTNILGNDFALDDISFTPVCEQTATVQVTVNTTPVVTAETDLVFCEGDAVPVNAFVSTPGGTTFNWTNSATTIGLAANGTGNLPAFTATNTTSSPITATISVTPSSGSCVGAAVDFDITVNPLPSVGAGVDQTVCEGDAVTLTATNPDGASLSWTNGVTNGVAFTPAVGSLAYTVTATNLSTGCFATDVVTVTVIDVPVVTVNPAGPFSTLSGVQNLTASPAGGTWSADCGACINASTGAFNPATAGNGTWEICYTAGTAPCTQTDCIFITVTDDCLMSGSVTFSNPTCFGFNDGSVTINVTGANGTPVFSITDSADNTVNSGSSNTANNLAEGWYYFNVTDDLGCTLVDSVLIEDPGAMTIDLQVQNPLCYGINNGYAVVDTVYNYTGAYGQIGYYWNPNPSGTNGLGEDSLTSVGEGSYNLLINDANGCSESFDFIIQYPDSLYLIQLGSEPAYCRLFSYQSGNGVVFAAAAGGTPDYVYTWTNMTTGAVSSNTTWGGLNPGNYQIQVTDDNGCVLTEVITLDSLNPVADFALASPDFSASYEGNAVVNVHFDNQSLYYANPNDPNADTTFFWHFGFAGEPWILSNDITESFDVSYTDGGEYNVCLVALNKNGCTDTSCVLIVVYDSLTFTPVNVFTPDGDGSNDFFTFNYRASSIDEFSCVIVDRWGVVIHELSSVSDSWDGSDKSGKACPAGVYFYTYAWTSFNGITGKGQGTIHLVH
ncbi:MAG: gliding motility-associated C-terminal domain-containing protein [Bacteroidetes bacterium]|nr:gliding motility-associated C-terminal domain-containing protein [Bacteroidota bacterium]